MKRGQATLFVIVGLLIVILIGLGVFFRGEIKTLVTDGAEAIRFSDEEQNIRDVISSCLEETISNGIFLAQKQSGHIYVVQDYLDFEGIQVPYVYDGSVQVITVKEMQEEFQRYIAEDLELCVQGLDANFEQVSSRVSVNSDGVSAEVIYPFSISLEGFETRNDYPYSIAIEEKDLVDFVLLMRDVATAMQREPGAIPLGVLIGQERFRSDLVPSESEVLYSLESVETGELYFFSASLR